MEFTILGPLVVSHGGESARLAGVLQRRLLTALLLNVNVVVPADRLIHILWGDDARATAARNLHTQVWRVRAALDECLEGGSAALVTQPPGYLLRVDPEAVDAVRFERMVTEATTLPEQQPDQVAERLTRALELWQGPALAEFADDEFCRHETMRLEELRLFVVEQRFEARLALGRHTELIGEIEAFAAEHPLRERPCGLQMTALHRSGRQADAVAVYQRFRNRLVDQLGLEPSAALRERHQHILNDEAESGVVHERPVVRPGSVRRKTLGNLRFELSELIGRDAETGLALTTLARQRVVTITGAGGVGKTRL
ncbi:MAG: AfsR/SARP family transcriptional regulator, partial [Kibdelosporangium sp.]